MWPLYKNLSRLSPSYLFTNPAHKSRTPLTADLPCRCSDVDSPQFACVARSIAGRRRGSPIRHLKHHHAPLIASAHRLQLQPPLVVVQPSLLATSWCSNREAGWWRPSHNNIIRVCNASRLSPLLVLTFAIVGCSSQWLVALPPQLSSSSFAAYDIAGSRFRHRRLQQPVPGRTSTVAFAVINCSLWRR